jgi:hypothetical protein
MESKSKEGKRKRFSFRYEPRLYAKLQSIHNKTMTRSEPAETVPEQAVGDSPARHSFVLLGHASQGGPVLIRAGHTLVCGQTGSSGKTTCIEKLLSRWPGNENRKKKIVAFITKEEEVFQDFRRIRPYINTKPDSDFLSLVIESMFIIERRPLISKKISLTLAELCHNTKTLGKVLKNANKMLKKVKDRDKLKRDVCIILRHCLTRIFPHQGQINQDEIFYDRSDANDSKVAEDIDFDDNNDNVVMDISAFSDEVRTLVIGSVAYEILKHHQDAILVVPDGWAIFATDGMSLGRFQIESLISEGLQKRNHVIIESLDIERIPLHVRRQMTAILLGYQLWWDEAKLEIRALRDLASFMRRTRTRVTIQKPFLTRFDIQRLQRGEFYAFPSFIEGNDTGNLNKVIVKS